MNFPLLTLPAIVLSTVWAPLAIFSFPLQKKEDIFFSSPEEGEKQTNKQTKQQIKYPPSYHIWPVLTNVMNKDRNYICLHEAWFIFRGEVPRRCARDYLCPLLFYLPCWDIYMAPTTVPKCIGTYSYSYNTQVRRRDYMGYLRSEVWSRTDHYTDFTSTWSVGVYQPFLYKSTPSPIPKTFRLLKKSSGIPILEALLERNQWL